MSCLAFETIMRAPNCLSRDVTTSEAWKSSPMVTKQMSKLSTPSALMMVSFVQSQMFESVKRPESASMMAGFLSTIMTSLPSACILLARWRPVRPMPMMRTDFMRWFLSLIIR